MPSVTLITHCKVFPETCYKQNNVIFTVIYGVTIQNMVDNFNKTKNKDIITSLYNKYGQEIHKFLWNIQIKENIEFYIDQ